MAIITYRNNIQAMIAAISFMMVVSTGRFVAMYALQLGRMFQFIGFYRIINSAICQYLFGVFTVSVLAISFIGLFAENALFVLLMNKLYPCFLVLVSPFIVCGYALFASRTNTVFVSFFSTKLRNNLAFLAHRTLFGYNLFGHNLFLYKRYWLEPIAGYIPVVGLSYVTSRWDVCQGLNSRRFA